SERQLRYPIIGYLRGIKGIFRTENSRNPVFGFRLLGKGAILQRSRPFYMNKLNYSNLPD
ncbi:TPA: hypothetical protein ACFP4Q_000477, partial [Neisseria weaveri]